MTSHHETTHQHPQAQQPNEYIGQADKDYHGKNDNWTQDFIHDHYKPGQANHAGNYDDNVRKTAAEAWARIKSDLRDGQVGSEDKTYWDRSKAAKDYIDLQKTKAAGGPEGEFAGKVLAQVEKLQRSLHEDNEMQKLGFSKFDHVLGADANGRLEYQTKGNDGKYYSEKRTAGDLSDVPTSTTNARKSVTEGTEANSDGSSSNFRRSDSNDNAPNGQPKASHSEYPDEDGKRDINGRTIDNARSVDKQYNEKTGGWDYKVRTKDGQDIAYSTDKDDKNATFAPSLQGQGAMQGKTDQSLPIPGSGTDLRHENEVGDGKFEGSFNDGYAYDTGFKRSDETDAQGHLTTRTVEYDAGKHSSADLNVHDKSGHSLKVQDIRKVETSFDAKTGRYETTYTDGAGKQYHATLSADMKEIINFHD